MGAFYWAAAGRRMQSVKRKSSMKRTLKYELATQWHSGTVMMELLLFIKSVLPWKHYCCSCYCRLRCYADIHGSCCCCWFLSWNCLTSILTLLLVFSAYLTHTHAHTLLLQLAVVISAKRSVNEVSERAISDFRKHIKIELWHMRATTHIHGYKPAIGCDVVSASIFKCFSCVCVCHVCRWHKR